MDTRDHEWCEAKVRDRRCFRRMKVMRGGTGLCTQHAKDLEHTEIHGWHFLTLHDGTVLFRDPDDNYLLRTKDDPPHI